MLTDAAKSYGDANRIVCDLVIKTNSSDSMRDERRAVDGYFSKQDF